MENSVTENDEQKSFRSPPRRRRSTFFERRDSFVPQAFTDNIDSNICKKLSEMDDKHTQDLFRYHDNLVAEKDQWKMEVNRRRNKYHDLKQQYQMALTAPSRTRISYSSLSTEDIEFLKSKVNVTKIVDSQLKLHQSVKETQALYRRAMELDNVLLNHCEEKVKEVTDYILENSTIEPKE
ncbi:uncharacterized protein LOC126777736 [Nymphalis io]|uniref:uncharacterized protein LOC126777736 n=1 Tax=Inachis io TaxID=171585 RepID=UPI0021678AF3|nr:uncharacterized protein LOC126777736 [Nymphalis io]